MKRICITLCAILVCITSMAQDDNVNRKINFEALVGMNVSKMGSYDSKLGFHLGVKGEMALPSIAKGVYVNAGALISQKGTKFNIGDLGSSNTTAYYLEVPVHIGWKYPLNNDLAVYGELGPYFAYGLGGKHKIKEPELGDNGDIVLNDKSYNTFDLFKRFDMGLGFRIGAEIKSKYTISIGYDFGFIDSWKGDDTDDGIDLTSDCKLKNFYISLGYKF